MLITSVSRPHEHTSAFSRRHVPELCIKHVPRKIEGAGKAGCSPHPQPRTQTKKAHERSRHRFAETIRPSLRNDRVFLPPSLRRNRFPRNLTPASGRQDHTALPSAISIVRLATPKRPPHPAPNVRDDREAPLLIEAG